MIYMITHAVCYIPVTGKVSNRPAGRPGFKLLTKVTMLVDAQCSRPCRLYRAAVNQVARDQAPVGAVGKPFRANRFVQEALDTITVAIWAQSR